MTRQEWIAVQVTIRKGNMVGFFNLLSLAILAGVFISANAVDYCNLASCSDVGEVHTMCQYPSSEPGPKCQQAHDVGLTDSEKKFIVKKHNELRQRVASGQETRGSPGPQPPASNMQDLTWDDELATIAQRYQVGQNIARTSTTGKEAPGIDRMINAWYNEVALFNNADVSPFKYFEETGHYTQMLWADTVTIGCG
ncbi:Venom allergen [Ooceraea biroi]|uniref:Venom allergen n=1 Tax=Ooceraea biroi TaxID=2015173 RepID=A0A026WI58_OOCBI|nr:Venom allergen [Ooceraea biroi]